MNQHLYIRDSNAVVTWIQKNACTAINASVDVFDVSEMDKANKILNQKIGFQVADIRGMYSYGTGKYPKNCSNSTMSIVKKLYAIDYLLFDGVNNGSA